MFQFYVGTTLRDIKTRFILISQCRQQRRYRQKCAGGQIPLRTTNFSLFFVKTVKIVQHMIYLQLNIAGIRILPSVLCLKSLLQYSDCSFFLELYSPTENLTIIDRYFVGRLFKFRLLMCVTVIIIYNKHFLTCLFLYYFL